MPTDKYDAPRFIVYCSSNNGKLMDKLLDDKIYNTLLKALVAKEKRN
jgi:hypothetical protein